MFGTVSLTNFEPNWSTLADIIDPHENTLYINNSHILTLNTVLTHDGLEPPLVLQERMRGVQSIF